MDQILQTLLDFCVNASLPLILGLCAIDIGFGIGVGLKSGTFDWRKIGQFYKTQIIALVLPYVIVLIVTSLVAGIVDLLPIELLPAAMLTGIVANLVGSIIQNGQALRG